MPRLLSLRIAFWVGVAGFALSLAVHIAALVGQRLPAAAFALHVGVFVAFVPALLGMKAWIEERGYRFDDVRGQWSGMKELIGSIPLWQALGLGALFVYATVNFGIGVSEFAEAPEDGFSFRLFSGHWPVFYAFSAVLARHLLRLGQRVAEPS